MSTTTINTFTRRFLTLDGKDAANLTARARLVSERLDDDHSEVTLAPVLTEARVRAAYPDLPDAVTAWDPSHRAMLNEPAFKISAATLGNLARAYRLPSTLGAAEVTDRLVSAAYKVVTRSGTAQIIREVVEARGRVTEPVDPIVVEALLFDILRQVKERKRADANPTGARDVTGDDAPANDGVAVDVTPLDASPVRESVESVVAMLDRVASAPWTMAELSILYPKIDAMIGSLTALQEAHEQAVGVPA